MSSQSLAEEVLKAVTELEVEIQKLIRRIPGAVPEELFRSYRILGRLEILAERRVDDSTAEAFRRQRLAVNPATNFRGSGE